MASGLITSWEIDGETVETVTDFILGAVVLEKTLHSKGGQSWVFIGRTDVEAETPILWPADVKS